MRNETTSNSVIGFKNSEQISQSEEHLVVESIDSEKYEVGDVIYGAPFHICPTVAKYNYAQIVKNQRLWIIGKLKVKITCIVLKILTESYYLNVQN